MKILLALHGYPPELRGGTENAVQALARGLARRGHAVVVVAGSMDWEAGFRVTQDQDTDPASGRSIDVYRIHRDDLYFDHWQKSLSTRAAAAFRDIVERERPDVVHVHHWIRLSRDLVAQAARAGVPAVVTLHDLWSTCLITFRVRPDTRRFCDAPLAANPCLACAGAIPPHTPWVPVEDGWRLIAEHRADLVRELQLARAVAVPTRAHANAVERFLALDEPLALRVLPPARELDLAPRPAPPGPSKPAGAAVLKLGAWGHLGALKGQDILLGALARTAQPERIELHLAGGEGDPAFAAQLRELAGACAAKVVFHGAFEPEDLGSHPVTDVHAMVSASRAHESWGLVLDEALALGVPALLPRRGAFEERATGAGWGVLFEPDDEASLAAEIDALLADLDAGGARLAALRAAALETSTATLSESELLDEWVATYADAAAAGPPAVADAGWWEARMRAAFEEQWDAELRRRSGVELGFEEAP